jgi:hypothetical protein
MTRYQAAMLPRFAALAKTRAPSQRRAGAHEVGDVVPVTSRTLSHEAADSAIRQARPFTLPRRWQPHDASPGHPSVLLRIWRTAARWLYRRDFNAHR